MTLPKTQIIDINKNAEKLWMKCLKMIKQEISPQNYTAWFLPIKPKKLEGNIFTIEVPSLFFYEWLEEHYINLLKKTLQYHLGNKCLLEYHVILNKPLLEFSLETPIKHQSIMTISSQISVELISYFSKHPNELKRIDRRLFEELIAELFYGFGFNIELTQKTRDGGRDIIAIKNVEAELKYLIECKRPEPGNPIGIKPVRELFGVKQDEKATKAILATTTHFSRDAILFFERNKWELEPKDFRGIMNWINDYKKIKKIG
jgi:hypothetical protein